MVKLASGKGAVLAKEDYISNETAHLYHRSFQPFDRYFSCSIKKTSDRSACRYAF